MDDNNNIDILEDSNNLGVEQQNNTEQQQLQQQAQDQQIQADAMTPVEAGLQPVVANDFPRDESIRAMIQEALRRSSEETQEALNKARKREEETLAIIMSRLDQYALTSKRELDAIKEDTVKNVTKSIEETRRLIKESEQRAIKREDERAAALADLQRDTTRQIQQFDRLAEQREQIVKRELQKEIVTILEEGFKEQAKRQQRESDYDKGQQKSLASKFAPESPSGPPTTGTSSPTSTEEDAAQEGNLADDEETAHAFQLEEYQKGEATHAEQGSVAMAEVAAARIAEVSVREHVAKAEAAAQKAKNDKEWADKRNEGNARKRSAGVAHQYGSHQQSSSQPQLLVGRANLATSRDPTYQGQGVKYSEDNNNNTTVNTADIHSSFFDVSSRESSSVPSEPVAEVSVREYVARADEAQRIIAIEQARQQADPFDNDNEESRWELFGRNFEKYRRAKQLQERPKRRES